MSADASFPATLAAFLESAAFKAHWGFARDGRGGESDDEARGRLGSSDEPRARSSKLPR